MKKTITYLLASAALGAFTGCQATDNTASNTKKSGNYSGARHMSVGSNIPQRESVDATGATYDPDQFQNFQGARANGGLTGTLNGGGAR